MLIKTKFFFIPLLLTQIISCHQNGAEKSEKDSLSIIQKNDTLSDTSDEKATPNSLIKNDSALMSLSNDILTLIKNNDYTHLSSFIHPDSGIRFSPYGFVDTGKNQHLSRNEFINLVKSKKIIRWGFFEGTGEPISLSLNAYFKRFVYDADFITAQQKSVNKIVGSDSSLSNVSAIYPDCGFEQFYFSGINKKYQGMDWKSLVLIYKEENGKLFLVGIVHDEWKI